MSSSFDFLGSLPVLQHPLDITTSLSATTMLTLNEAGLGPRSTFTKALNATNSYIEDQLNNFMSPFLILDLERIPRISLENALKVHSKMIGLLSLRVSRLSNPMALKYSLPRLALPEDLGGCIGADHQLTQEFRTTVQAKTDRVSGNTFKVLSIEEGLSFHRRLREVLVNSISRLKTQIIAMNRQLKVSSTKIKKLSDEAKSYKAEKKRFERKIDDLNRLLENSKFELKQKQDPIKKLRQQNTQLVNQCENKNEEIGRLNNLIRRMQLLEHKYKEDIEKLRGRIAELEKSSIPLSRCRLGRIPRGSALAAKLERNIVVNPLTGEPELPQPVVLELHDEMTTLANGLITSLARENESLRKSLTQRNSPSSLRTLASSVGGHREVKKVSSREGGDEKRKR